MKSNVPAPLSSSSYHPPRFLRTGHSQTIFPSIFRIIHGVSYQRERIETDDDDFLDLDWLKCSPRSRSLVVLCHGLEGNSSRTYMRGMARAANQERMDALAWNYRSCSETMNRQLRFYHNGATDDLQRVLQHADRTGEYSRIVLIGFSLGGNLILNYLARHRDHLPHGLTGAVLFSVPLHLASSADALARPSNRIYMKRFLKDLKKKIIAREKQFPGRISSSGYHEIQSFRQFDDRYTAPIHGFKDAEDYWQQCSGLYALPRIPLPTLIVNAKNDPFLCPESFPDTDEIRNPLVTLWTPTNGGHCGFPGFQRNGRYWSEDIAFLLLQPPPAQ